MKDRKKCGRKRKSTALEADEPEADMEAESEVAHAAKEVITGKRKHGRKRKSAVLEADEPEPEPEPVSWLGSTSVIWTSRDTYPDPSTQWPSSTDFHSLQCPLLTPCSIRHHTGEPVGHFEHNRSYSNILLSHASLYVSVDFWLIDELKALAIYKLHKTLYIFELDDQKVTNIVDLARYAYEKEVRGTLGAMPAPPTILIT
ncbi:hypothetical protein B7494_g7892 [Chlorociboria aeruginascens]|nr:hypothetical protein B7494_g7892 [Chlorociboria aeruginascens]